MRLPRPRLLAVLPVLGLLAVGCGGNGATDGPEGQILRVVATTSILGDIVGQLVGEDGEVEVLMGPGVDPHAFSPSAAQAAAVRDADLVVANGLGLEESLVDLLEAAEADGAAVLELAPQLEPIEFGTADEEDHAGEEDHGHDEGGSDPHVWFDPVRMADGAAVLAARLAEVDDTLADEEWEQRGAELAASLLALDEEVRAILETIPAEQRVLVTNHDAIGYLASRYDLEIVDSVVPGGGTLASADAGRIAALADVIRDRDLPAIFAENTTDDRLARSLAREVGRDVEVVTLYTDALGEAGSGAETYAGLLRTDARLIADALG